MGKSTRRFGIIKKNMIEFEKVEYRLDTADPNMIMERKCLFCGHYYLMKQFIESQYWRLWLVWYFWWETNTNEESKFVCLANKNEPCRIWVTANHCLNKVLDKVKLVLKNKVSGCITLHIVPISIYRSSHPEMFLEKVFWKHAGNLQENAHAGVCNTSAWVFSCKFAPYFQNIFF